MAHRELFSHMVHGADSAVQSYDELGFETDPAYEKYLKEYYGPKMAERTSRWKSLFEANHWKDAWDVTPDAGLLTRYRLKKLVRGGIPHEFRPALWLVLSGALTKRRSHPGLFRMLLESHAGQVGPAYDSIEKDLSRTFPTNIQFSEGGRLIDPLRTVLRAFSWYRPDIGYCQGLNFIAGALLLVCSEEEAFWLLSTLVNAKLPPDYYTDAMIGVHTDQLHFADLLQEKLPDVAAHLRSLGADLRLLCGHWFVCCFANCMHWPLLFRVFDVLFAETSKVLFRVALAIFIVHRERLLAVQDLAELHRLMKELPADASGTDAVMKTAFALGTMRSAQLHAGRARQRERVQLELEESARRRAEYMQRQEQRRSAEHSAATSASPAPARPGGGGGGGTVDPEADPRDRRARGDSGSSSGRRNSREGGGSGSGDERTGVAASVAGAGAPA